MNDLGAIMGSLLSGLAEARSVADNAAKQIAVSYESDALLRLFPVPRLDFSSVEADLSVILHELQEAAPPAETPVTPGVNPDQVAEELLRQTYEILGLSRHPRSKPGLLFPRLLDLYKKRLGALVQEAKRSVLPAPLRMPRLQIGATATELEKAAPAAIGRIKLNVGVQNYEWVEVDQGADGEPVRRLVPTGR